MIDRLIEDRRDLALLFRFLEQRRLPITVKISDGRLRSVEQNRLQWLWAQEAASQRGDVTSDDVQAEWKMRFGVPIMCSSDDSFLSTWSAAERKLTYEERTELIRLIPITSLMNVTQLKAYLDQVYLWNTENGIELTEPEELRGTKAAPRVGWSDTAGGTTIVGKKTHSHPARRKVR